MKMNEKELNWPQELTRHQTGGQTSVKSYAGNEVDHQGDTTTNIETYTHKSMMHVWTYVCAQQSKDHWTKVTSINSFKNLKRQRKKNSLCSEDCFCLLTFPEIPQE